MIYRLVNADEVVARLDNDFNIVDKSFISFTMVKKYTTDDIIYFKKDQFDTDLEQCIFMRDSQVS